MNIREKWKWKVLILGSPEGLYPVPQRVIKIIIVHTLVIIYPAQQLGALCEKIMNSHRVWMMWDSNYASLPAKHQISFSRISWDSTLSLYSKLFEKLFHTFLILDKKFAAVTMECNEPLSKTFITILSLSIQQKFLIFIVITNVNQLRVYFWEIRYTFKISNVIIYIGTVFTNF